MEAELRRVREWAQTKIASGEEPPWAWYSYMKLREALDDVLGGMSATTTVSSQQSAERPATHLRLVADTDPPDSARSRRAGPAKPPLPM